MKRADSYEVLPIESVYGAIQVKSKLGAPELESALKNIASFKRLNPTTPDFMSYSGRKPSTRGFGIIFAYDLKMNWVRLTEVVKSFAQENPAHLWPNLVVVLNVGIVCLGTENQGFWHNADLDTVANPTTFGMPDQGDNLYSFYIKMLGLLRETRLSTPPVDDYFQLPLLAGDIPYQFSFGDFAEYATCDLHGDYLRKISASDMRKIIEYCQNSQTMNWIRASDLAMFWRQFRSLRAPTW